MDGGLIFPTLDEIDEYVPVTTPMDKKTIVNAITKRIQEAREIDLVGHQLVVVCQLAHETAIIVEDDFNPMMRHRDLMNVVDRLADEVAKRKKRLKTNKLPHDFFSSSEPLDLKKYAG